MTPVHDYQNFLHILSLTLIKYIRFRKKYFILTSILFRESYSRWVCLKNSEHYHIWYSNKLEFLLREVVSLCYPFIYNAKFGIVNDINYGTPFYIIFS